MGICIQHAAYTCPCVRVYTSALHTQTYQRRCNCAAMRATLLEQIGCFACRVGVAYVIGDILQRRVELNTPLHSLISLREALFWKDIGRSPYTSSYFRGPPLLLPLFRWTSVQLVRQVVSLSVVDWITAHLLSSVADQVNRFQDDDVQGVLHKHLA